MKSKRPFHIQNRVSRLALAVMLVPGVCVLPLVAGCGPSQEEIRLARAMQSDRHELHPGYRETIHLLEQYRQDPKHKNEYVQYGMCETMAAMLGGDTATAQQVGTQSFTAVQRYEDKDRESQAALGAEDVKFFKGEPHERALLCYYTGLTYYLHGEYNEARMFFTQALNAIKTKDDDMAEFREDFRLGWFWLARAYLRRGETDDARAALPKAAVALPHDGQEKEIARKKSERTRAYKKELEGEAKCYENGTKGKATIADIVDLSKECSRTDMPAALDGAAPHDPTLRRASSLEDFLSLDFQQDVNLIVIIEMGMGPIKYLKGSGSALDQIKPAPYREAGADVYVDGHRSSAAFCLLDTYHQAATRGTQTRRGRQITKAVAKEILSHMPYAGMFSGLWKINADARYWPSLPGEYHVYAARVEPGLHTLQAKFYDINDNYLPRYDVTRHYINVPADGDVVIIINSLENQDNAYLLTESTPSK